MKTFILIGVILASISILHARAKMTLVDNTVVFNDGYDVKTATFSKIVEDPTAFEVSVATSGLKFESLSDYQRCLDDKEYLRDKIDDLQTSDARKKAATVSFIKSENNKR